MVQFACLNNTIKKKTMVFLDVLTFLAVSSSHSSKFSNPDRRGNRNRQIQNCPRDVRPHWPGLLCRCTIASLVIINFQARTSPPPLSSIQQWYISLFLPNSIIVLLTRNNVLAHCSMNALSVGSAGQFSYPLFYLILIISWITWTYPPIVYGGVDVG